LQERRRGAQLPVLHLPEQADGGTLKAFACRCDAVVIMQDKAADKAVARCIAKSTARNKPIVDCQSAASACFKLLDKRGLAGLARA
jgi:hypothetical protein